MPKQIITTVYEFDELFEKAKEKAREWYRSGAFEYDWWDGVYDTAATVADYLGINLRQKPVKLMNGKTRYEPEIYFSGFSHQGSGSSFAGTWYARDVKADKLKAEFPSDEELHRLADEFAALAKENPELSASIKANRDNWINVEVEHGETRNDVLNSLEYKSEEWKVENQKDVERVDRLTEALKDFNRWIYKSLEREYEYLNADEQVDESIRANGYTFTEQGKREG